MAYINEQLFWLIYSLTRTKLKVNVQRTFYTTINVVEYKGMSQTGKKIILLDRDYGNRKQKAKPK